MLFDESEHKGDWIFSPDAVQVGSVPNKYAVFSPEWKEHRPYDYVYVDPISMDILYVMPSGKWDSLFDTVRTRVKMTQGADAWSKLWEDDLEWDAILDYLIERGEAEGLVFDMFASEEFVDSF